MTPDLGELMAGAVELCVRHVQAGGLPFVGLVVADGWTAGPGVNRVRETGDPSAHAEIVAMRQAIRERGTGALVGTTLLATGEPCSLCYGFAAEHGVAAVSYAVGRDDAAAWGFDYRDPRGAAPSPLEAHARHLKVPDALRPFTTHRRLRAADTQH